ncbi:uncharacterized protein [Anas platyrhynchos]|uniref:uncharacterized protein isoform X2 n=1 Tax=Anas platyrhynchos TaxID=8839 RepID=UPI003AF27C84
MRSVYFSASEGPPRTVSISQSSVSKQQAPAERGPALSAPARPQADESEEGNLPHGCILKSRCRSDCFLPKHAALRQGTGQVPCVVPHRPSCQGSRAEHLYCTGRRRFSLQPTISEAELT